MDSRVWLQLSWTDSRLAWNETEFLVLVLRVPADKLWKPDIFLYNGAKPSMSCYAANALLYPTGKIWWEPACRLQTYCNLTLTNAPYEEQTCTMRFGSRTFDGATMGLELWKEGNGTLADVSYFVNQKYKITKNEAIKEEILRELFGAMSHRSLHVRISTKDQRRRDLCEKLKKETGLKILLYNFLYSDTVTTNLNYRNK
ncbi:acetylcholine receptor subunit beta-like 1 [Folsomia candida]|uniref:acetylcholine receptor subunit beta-like 1 n=1 Tax=Folsomia candida TaxID=158441 RepID=UPI00160516A4|nr:acetylcholine receptor subunit beta-like 1 [Folsomia candida]